MPSALHGRHATNIILNEENFPINGMYIFSPFRCIPGQCWISFLSYWVCLRLVWWLVTFSQFTSEEVVTSGLLTPNF